MGLIVYLISFSSAIILLLLLIRMKSIFVFAPLVLLVLYYFPASIDFFLGNNDYDRSTLFKANLYALYVNFNLIFTCFLFLLFNKNVNEKNKFETIGSNFQYFIVFLFFISLVILFFAVYKSTNGHVFSYSWATKHGSDGNNIFFLISSYLFIAFSCSVFITLKTGERKLFYFSVLLAILYVLLIRSRGFIVPVLLTFVFYYLVYQRKYLSSLYIGVGFLLIFFIMQQIRYLGELNNISDLNISVVMNNIVNKISDNDSEFSLKNAYYYFIQNYDVLRNSYNFGDYYTYRRILFFWDGFDLGLKPKDFTNKMYLAYYGGTNPLISNPTLHPTLYGTIYANGLYISSLIFTLYFSLLLFAENCIKKASTEFYWMAIPVFSYSCIFLARGSVYNAFLVLLLCLIIQFIFLTLYRILNKLKVM